MINEKLPRIVTETVPGPRSKAMLERKNTCVSQGVGTGFPVCITEAKGALMKDIDGNVYLDFAAGIGVQNVGHCDEDVVSAICRQAQQFIHPCFHVAMYEPYIALAERLCSLVKISGEKRAMFANSGSEAVENAIKLARKYTKKTGIVSLECAFHGRTYMAMTITSKVKPYKNGFGPFNPETYKIPTPYYYRFGYGYDNEVEFAVACAEKFATMLKGEWSADTIAAVIAEPVQGEGGFIAPPKEYYQTLERICRENGILLIIDEVQAGFARTGTLFAYEHYGINPDLVVMSKSIAAGVPLSGVVGRREIMDAVNPGEIGGTYGGSPLGCAAAMAVLDKIERDNLTQKAVSIGDIMYRRLHAMQKRYPMIGDVRGLGAMAGIEFVKDPVSKEPYPEIVKRIIACAQTKGVVFLGAGIFSNVLRFLPPLVMTPEQVEYGMDVLEQAIEESQL
ncbi:MAG: 4-aminobutyrate--2-oxoglutarate transaminase [Acetanaerobacterium sp.]